MHRDGSSIVAISCLVEKGRAKYWLNVLARRCKIKDTKLRQRVVMEAQQLISDPLKGKYAYDILWNLLVTTVKNS